MNTDNNYQEIMVNIEQCITYPYNLQMYTVPPSGNIKLEELRQWCINRLRVLKLVEQISAKNYRKAPIQCAEILVNNLKDHGIFEFVNLMSLNKYPYKGVKDLSRNDCASHFMLCSGVSFDITKSQWLIKQETKLFAWRLSLLDNNNTKIFIDRNGFQYPLISPEETQEIKEYLRVSSIEGIENIHNIKFYKIPFVNVLKLVKRRHIFLKDGIAYVPETKMFWVIVAAFRKALFDRFSYARINTSNIYHNIEITEIINILTNCIRTQNVIGAPQTRVTVDELDKLSETAYPLCMRLLHEGLRENHHLTNGGRVQYTLFLKGIGVTLNDALQLWREELTKICDEKKYEKEYKYYIRHLYGDVGRRAKYAPSPCFKIFKAKIGLRDRHGCPYKHMQPHVLETTLSKCGLVGFDRDSIVKLSKDGHYLQACKTYYEAKHFCIIKDTIDHPNAFFEYSYNKIRTEASDSED